MDQSVCVLPVREQLLVKQAWVYCSVCIVVILAVLFAGPIPLSWQVFSMIPLVILLGLPHGTTDVWEGQSLFRPVFRRNWWLPFGVFYLLLSAFVVFAWNLAPEVSLWLFLLASAFHFGACDSSGDFDGGLRIFNVIFRGLAPITLPTLLHGKEVEAAFQALRVNNPVVLLTTLKWLAVLSIAGLTIIGIRNLFAYKDSRRILGFEPFFEIALLVLAPPILGFGISFAFLHSSRHLIDFWTEFQLEHPEKSLNQVLRSSTAVWLLTVILGSAMFAFNPIGSVSTRIIYVVFVGLAALTLPHMILEAIKFSKRKPIHNL